jgi:hypothetical protein
VINMNPFGVSSYNLTPHNFDAFKTILDEYPSAYKTLTNRLFIGVSLVDENESKFKRCNSVYLDVSI